MTSNKPKNGEIGDTATEATYQRLLHPEEALLWQLAADWGKRDPRAPDLATGPLVSPAGDELDWERFVEVGRRNRMQPFMLQCLAQAGRLERLPAHLRDSLQEDVDKLDRTASEMGHALRQYLACAEERGLDTVVIKGLSVSANLYGSPSLRPGGDIDLLVPRAQVGASLQILDQMGLGQWWPNLLDDDYYDRHHLHQQRCSPDLRIWFEVHWALDHPYTLLTIDYPALFGRTTRGELLGQPLRELAPPDLLLSLAVHLVKHAVYLPSVLHRSDLARIILADGMLLNYLDIAQAVKCHAAALDWEFLVGLARGSGVVDMLGSVLSVCREYLRAPVPDWVVDALPVRTPVAPIRNAMTHMADYAVVAYLGQQPNRLWQFMVVTNGAFILRPIRVLDTAAYFFPGADFMRRRYGNGSWTTRATHLARAVAQYGRLAFDTVYYTWRRHRRLKALGQSASLFNRLEVED